MTVELMQGMRRYTCLVPVVVIERGKETTYRHVHLRPVTRRIERRWQDGEIQGPYGALEALIDELLYEPYYVVEEMQHPDVDLFNREFLCHLPRSIADMLARGEYPAPAPLPPTGYDDDDPAPPGLDRFPDRPPTRPDRPLTPDPSEQPAYVGPETDEAPAPNSALSGVNFDLAEAGPDDSLGTPAQREQADQAFQARRAPGDGLDLARELVEEPAAPSPLKAAVDRAAADKPAPDAEAPGRWVPTPRDPFDPSRAPEKASTNRPPTRLSAETQAGWPPPLQTSKDPRTGREPIFKAPPDYVPDMHAAGYEEIQRPSRNAFGIEDTD